MYNFVCSVQPCELISSALLCLVCFSPFSFSLYLRIFSSWPCLISFHACSLSERKRNKFLFSVTVIPACMHSSLWPLWRPVSHMKLLDIKARNSDHHEIVQPPFFFFNSNYCLVLCRTMCVGVHECTNTVESFIRKCLGPLKLFVMQVTSL